MPSLPLDIAGLSSAAPSPPPPQPRPQARFEDHLDKAARPQQDEARPQPAPPGEQALGNASGDEPAHGPSTTSSNKQKQQKTEETSGKDRDERTPEQQTVVVGQVVVQSSPGKSADLSAELKMDSARGKHTKAKTKPGNAKPTPVNVATQQQSTGAAAPKRPKDQEAQSPLPAAGDAVSDVTDKGDDSSPEQSSAKEPVPDAPADPTQNATAIVSAITAPACTNEASSPSTKNAAQTITATVDSSASNPAAKSDVVGAKRNRAANTTAEPTAAGIASHEAAPASGDDSVATLRGSDDGDSSSDGTADRSSDAQDAAPADSARPEQNDNAEPRAATTPALLAARHDRSHEAAGRSDGLTEAERVRFVQRVASAFRSMGDEGGEVHLRLSPPELGALRVELSVRDGVLSARMETETSAARNLLLDNLPALRDRLADQNIKVERFDVDVRDEQRQAQHDQFAGQGNLPQSKQRNRPSPYAARPSSTAADRIARGSLRQGDPGQLNIVI